MEKSCYNKKIKLKIKSQYQNIKPILNILSFVAAQAGFSDIDVSEIVGSFAEALSNCIEHGYKENPDGWIEIFLRETEHFLEVDIMDYGTGFEIESLDLYNPDNETHIYRFRGRGLFIINSLMDYFRIESSKGSGTRLVFRKHKKKNNSKNAAQLK